jgi:GNAT superfamily N-acetyltransferase
MEGIVAEYLPGTGLGDLRKYYDTCPAVFLGYYINGMLEGVVYGFEVEPGHFSLDGIAMSWDYKGKGRGSRLIASFEKQVKALGCRKITLGSADGYVEHFYLKNGYTPVEMKILTLNPNWEAKSANCLFPVAYTQTQGEYTKLVIPVSDYHGLDKTAFTEYYDGVDSFIIFKKELRKEG